MSNELSQEDKELIAKIDERLKHYKLIKDNEQSDYNWQKQIELNKKPKPLNIAPVEWKVGEWAWSGSGNLFLGTIKKIDKHPLDEVILDNQNGKIRSFGLLEYLIKPTKEEIEQHLVKIAEKKYKVGDILDDSISKLKITSLEYHYTNGNLYAQSCCINTGIIGGDERITDTEIWSHKHGWADFKSEPTPKITEQKERWKPNSGEEYYYINEVFTIQPTVNSHFMLDSPRIEAGNCFKTKEEAERVAQAIRKTLKNL